MAKFEVKDSLNFWKIGKISVAGEQDLLSNIFFIQIFLIFKKFKPS